MVCTCSLVHLCGRRLCYMHCHMTHMTIHSCRQCALVFVPSLVAPMYIVNALNGKSLKVIAGQRDVHSARNELEVCASL